MIQTSYFRARGLPLAQRVAISLTVPRGYAGRRYPALAPPRALLEAYRSHRITWEEYQHDYRLVVLDPMDPARMAADLEGSILCCWERDRQHCHRSIVSAWLTERLGIEVPEWQPPAVEF